jgi:hypothetical protein
MWLEAEWLQRDGRLRRLALIRWWEQRRARYNLVVLLAVVASAPLWIGASALVTLLVGPFEKGAFSWELLAFGLAVTAGIANLSYTLGWLVDLSTSALLPARHSTLRDSFPRFFVRLSWVCILGMPLVYVTFWLAISLWIGGRILMA